MQKGRDRLVAVESQSRQTPVILSILILLAGLLTTASAEAKLPKLLQRPVVIHNARIVTMDGSVIEKGTLLMKGDRIGAVGANVNTPWLAKSVDAKGGTVTPGLIDVYSALGRSGAGGGSATHRAEDAFDHFDTADLREALRHGVTAVFLSPSRSSGTLGTGAIMRLAPRPAGREGLGKVLKSKAALCLGLGSERRPISRLKTLASLRKQFQDASDHRRAMENYREDVKEYEKKLKEWLAKKKGKKPKKGGKPAPKMAAAKGKPVKGPVKKGGKDAQPKKPRPPRRKPHLDIVLQALDRKMPVRILAHRTEDILNALELAERYSFNLIVEGGAEAHLVAQELAKAKALVILDHTCRDNIPKDNVYRRATRNAGEVLSAAGVRWVVGSGAANPAGARFVAMISQMEAARGGRDNPLKMITADAAEALKASDQIGRLRPGLLADLVIWSGDPLEPASTVRQVYVGGTLVFEGTDGGKERGKK